jgi:hypothetical protein
MNIVISFEYHSDLADALRVPSVEGEDLRHVCLGLLAELEIIVFAFIAHVQAFPSIVCLRLGTSLRRELRACNEQPMQFAVFHGWLRDDAEDFSLPEQMIVVVPTSVYR